MNTGLDNIRKIYFLGIGGIGMSAMARYFHSRGILIHGYDKTPSDLTGELTGEGMIIHYDDDPGKIPADTDLVIYTPAIPQSLHEFIFLKESGILMMKRSKVTGLITEGKKTVAIAGTHGKTSISSMIAHILIRSGYPVTALIGGISKNYLTNYISSGKDDIMVVEADEYDRSFLELHPDIAVISAMDPDHLDIYGTTGEMNNSFSDFAGNIKPNGKLIIREGLQVKLRDDIRRIDYAAEELSEISGTRLRIADGMQLFDIFSCEYQYRGLQIQVPGKHNVENALAAYAVCRQLGVSKEAIIGGIESFAGVRRRFDVRINRPGRIYIDDYAHHPEELKAFINAVRKLYPEEKITGLFQPHLYSRTRDFAGGFAESLDMLDEAWLLDIYPARELPIPGVSSEMILKKMQIKNKRLVTKAEVPDLLRAEKPFIFLTIGAGDIDQLAEPVIAALS
jgi:UDP-N-acetylmuramate--alanine ligase